jgi:hypothetical protein
MARQLPGADDRPLPFLNDCPRGPFNQAPMPDIRYAADHAASDGYQRNGLPMQHEKFGTCPKRPKAVFHSRTLARRRAGGAKHPFRLADPADYSTTLRCGTALRRAGRRGSGIGSRVRRLNPGSGRTAPILPLLLPRCYPDLFSVSGGAA